MESLQINMVNWDYPSGMITLLPFLTCHPLFSVNITSSGVKPTELDGRVVRNPSHI